MMDVDAIQRRPLPGQRVTPEEMRRRIDNQLCRACGSNAHFIKDCPIATRSRVNQLRTDDRSGTRSNTSSDAGVPLTSRFEDAENE